VHEKPISLSSTLGVCNRDTIGSVRKEIKKLKRELEDLGALNPHKLKYG
jgi:hypothetical protein